MAAGEPAGGRHNVRSSAIVVAAGRGTRMGTPIAKAFLPLAGRPLVTYSLRTFAQVPAIDSIVLVVGAGEIQRAEQVVDGWGPWARQIRLATGGTERQDSVAAGLAAIDPASELVVIHDAARPFVSGDRVAACLAAAETAGAAIVALPARDTVKLVDANGSITQTIDRRRVWLAQTPQAFRVSLLRRAYDDASRSGVLATDDAALVERLGIPVHVVPGEATNLKITTPDDLRWAEWYLQSQPSAGR